jgi:DNA-binding NarL/FixJ family response regulator
MVAIAIVSANPGLRRDLAQALRGEPTIRAIKVADGPTAVLPLIEQNPPDVILTDASWREHLVDLRIQDGRIAVIVILDGVNDAETSRDALQAGARAILPRSSGREEIVAVIRAVMRDLVVLPHELFSTVLEAGPLGGELVDTLDGDHARLTPRELEVLTAMANGASNKAIARRLRISVHTVKFHVAAILTKLNAESRTEAVTKAAQIGLVML